MATSRFARTEQGHAEITQRLKNLRGKLRTVLFLVDPAKSVDDIQLQIAQIGGPVDALAQLVAGGYVVELGAAAPGAAAGAAQPTAAADEADRFRVAKAFMNDMVVDVLGIRAFMFTLRLERCATRADLAALLDDYAAALAKKLPPSEAGTLVERTRELLRPSA
jgi:hypothetical protein